MKLMTAFFTRSEIGPLQPFIKVAKEMGVEVEVIDLTWSWTEKTDRSGAIIRALGKEPDVVLAPFDRPEMVEVAYEAYHRNFPVAQLFSGDIAGGAYDDADRFVISNYATYLFCADYNQFVRTTDSQKWAQRIGWKKRIELVGATHFDNMEFVDPGIKDYTLVLYNPPSLLSRKEVENEVVSLCQSIASDDVVYWVAPNGDMNSDIVAEYAKDYIPLQSMPRREFLGWLKNAKKLVGNSSCAYYEAVFFGTPYVQVGVRNKQREPIADFMCKPGASKRIIEVLKEELD
ncbi:MAG: UDP-N-acetyl glucosamine 2-epimerase [Sphaerochaeta sp.]|jgi:UDP-N-acetylglucosamine 2-epimerase|nr:UDP-N-acetyl glucosamine 2-epimerase [Sphaerochaeta sp.]